MSKAEAIKAEKKVLLTCLLAGLSFGASNDFGAAKVACNDALAAIERIKAFKPKPKKHCLGVRYVI